MTAFVLGIGITIFSKYLVLAAIMGDGELRLGGGEGETVMKGDFRGILKGSRGFVLGEERSVIDIMRITLHYSGSFKASFDLTMSNTESGSCCCI